MDVKRLTDDDITMWMTDNVIPPNPYVSGYGAKIPSRYRITLTDGFTRRVYVMNYGNVGSSYVLVKGEVHFLP